MTPNDFFQHFEQLTDAPNAIEKMRELILQLALMGKLVPQDPNDEPASVLLGKIKVEKERLIKEKKIRRGKPLSIINLEDLPFDLPDRWEWVRLGAVGNIFNGNSINSHDKQTKYTNVTGLPYIATKDVGYGFDDLNYGNGISIPDGGKNFKIGPKDAVLICAEGGSAGKKCGITKQDICFGNKLFANEPLGGILSRLVLFLYLTPFFKSLFYDSMTGIIGGISIAKFNELLMPLPPLAEQKRIVERVDQLMTLCDKMEDQRESQQKARLRLNTRSLAHLTSAPDTDSFQHAWSRIRNQFHLLYDHPQTVAQLRQTILQLAVMGKLVPQEANDEPASVLLKKIKVEKERLIKEKKIKKVRPFPKIDHNDMSFELPIGWMWCSFADLIVFGPKNGYSPKAVEHVTDIKSITLTAITSGTFDETRFKYLDIEVEKDSHLWLQPGDLLLQRANSLEFVGVSAIYYGDKNTFIYPDLIMKIHTSNQVNSEYIHRVLSSDSARDYMRSRATGTSGSMPKVNQAAVNSIPIPLPPLAEQKRIVTQVDQLMTLCDQLETQLTQSQDHGKRLLNAAVARLLAA